MIINHIDYGWLGGTIGADLSPSWLDGQVRTATGGHQSIVSSYSGVLLLQLR